MTAVQSSIALGFFDGVHTAHRAIIETAVRKAETRGLRPVVLTFDKAPSEVLFGSAPPYITTLEEKERLINALGAQMRLMHTSRSLLSMTAEEFADENKKGVRSGSIFSIITGILLAVIGVGMLAVRRQ